MGKIKDLEEGDLLQSIRFKVIHKHKSGSSSKTEKYILADESGTITAVYFKGAPKGNKRKKTKVHPKKIQLEVDQTYILNPNCARVVVKDSNYKDLGKSRFQLILSNNEITQAEGFQDSELDRKLFFDFKEFVNIEDGKDVDILAKVVRINPRVKKNGLYMRKITLVDCSKSVECIFWKLSSRCNIKIGNVVAIHNGRMKAGELQVNNISSVFIIKKEEDSWMIDKEVYHKIASLDIKNINTASQLDNKRTFDNYDTANLQDILEKSKSRINFLKVSCQNVLIIGGYVQRYMGCTFCTKSVRFRDPKDKKFKCSSALCSKYNLETTRKICYCIQDIILKQESTTLHGEDFEILCFDEPGKQILEKEAMSFENDEEARNCFQNKIHENSFNLKFKGSRPDNQSQWTWIIEEIELCRKITTLEQASIIIPRRGHAPSPCTSSESDTDEEIERVPIGPLNVKIRHSKMWKKNMQGCYNLKTNPRGLALIINNVNYLYEGGYREGGEIDLINLKRLLEGLGYDIREKSDVKNKKELYDAITEFKDDLKGGYISSILIASGHGQRDQLELIEGSMAHIFDDITYKFDSDEFPEFEGKPKIFMFNGCDNFQGGQFFSFTRDVSKISDMIICSSTSPGFVSNRDPLTGSYYITALCKVFMDHAHNTHLEDLLYKVQRELANPNDERKKRQVSSHQGLVFDKFYFHPGLQ